MNDQFFKKIASEIKLSNEEREKMHLVLSEYMKIKPIRSEEAVAVAAPLAFLSFRYAFAGSLMAIIVITSGVSYAAEGSLPGDLLYGIKVSVVEEVRGAMTFSTEAEVDWEARRAERRLEEAQELAVAGRLNGEAIERIENNFNAHAERVEERIAELNSSGDEDQAEFLSSRFEVALSAHEAVLSKLAVEDGEETKTLAADIRAKVKKATASVAASSGGIASNSALKSAPETNTFSIVVHEESSTSSEADTSALMAVSSVEIDSDQKVSSRETTRNTRLSVVEKQKASASREIALVEGLLENESSFKTQVYNRAKNQFAKAKDLFAKGEISLSEMKNNEAFNFFKQSYKIAYELRVYIAAKTKLNMDITPLIVNPDTADNYDGAEPFNSSTGSELQKLSKEALAEAKKKLTEKKSRDEEVLKEAAETIKNAEYLFNRGTESYEENEEGSANRYFNASLTESLKAKALLDISIKNTPNATTTIETKSDDSKSEGVEVERENEDELEDEDKKEGLDDRGGLRSFFGL